MVKPLFALTGLAAIALGLVLLAAPQLYLGLYIAAPEQAAQFPAQRFAPAIVGLGALLFAARDLAPSPFAARFAAIAAAVWFGVSATGVMHYLSGTAGVAIVVAAGSEIVLGALFLAAAKQLRPN